MVFLLFEHFGDGFHRVVHRFGVHGQTVGLGEGREALQAKRGLLPCFLFIAQLNPTELFFGEEFLKTDLTIGKGIICGSEW